MRYLVAAILFAVASSGEAQNTTTTCRNSGGGAVTCNTQEQWKMPPIQPVDVGQALRAYDDGRRARNANDEAETSQKPISGAPEYDPVAVARKTDYSARELYVSCYMFAKRALIDPKTMDEYRANQFVCGGLAAIAINQYEGRQSDAFKQGTAFCLVHEPSVDVNPHLALAYEYMAFFEKYGASISNKSGSLSFAVAMAMKWPCT
jgi:hypothetical protein